jgi:hypothetical protein
MWLDVAQPAALVAVRRRAWPDIAARLLPVLLPVDSPCPPSSGPSARSKPQRIPARVVLLHSCAGLAACRDVRRRGTGCSLRLGLRLDIEVSVIGPERHDEVVQEALEPAQAERMRRHPNYILAADKASGT